MKPVLVRCKKDVPRLMEVIGPEGVKIAEYLDGEEKQPNYIILDEVTI